MKTFDAQQIQADAGERIAANAALLRLFQGEYRNSGDRHSDALFAKEYVSSLETKLREAGEANIWPPSLREITNLIAQEEKVHAEKLRGKSGKSEDYETGFLAGMRHVRENLIGPLP